MNAVFKKSNYILLVVFLIMALIWSGLCAFIIVKNNITEVGDIIACLWVTIIICSLGIITFLYNYKAYLHINGNKIVGRFGFFKRLECDINDVTSAFVRIDTIHIFLKDRKYYIKGIKNVYAINAFINQRIPFLTCDVTEELIANIKKHSHDQKKNIISVFCAMGLSFVWVFITIFLTGARDLPDFNNTDWVLFSIMCALEVLTIIVMFTFAIKSRKRNLPLEKQIYEVKRSILKTTPLLVGPGYTKSVLTDVEYSQRITIYCGCIENDDFSVCYSIEIFDEDYNLKFLYQSEIFTNEQSTEMFEGLLDITDKFIKVHRG